MCHRHELVNNICNYTWRSGWQVYPVEASRSLRVISCCFPSAWVRQSETTVLAPRHTAPLHQDALPGPPARPPGGPAFAALRCLWSLYPLATGGCCPTPTRFSGKGWGRGIGKSLGWCPGARGLTSKAKIRRAEGRLVPGPSAAESSPNAAPPCTHPSLHWLWHHRATSLHGRHPHPPGH